MKLHSELYAVSSITKNSVELNFRENYYGQYTVPWSSLYASYKGTVDRVYFSNVTISSNIDYTTDINVGIDMSVCESISIEQKQ